VLAQSLVAEKVRQVSDELVRDGKLNPEQARVFVDDMMQLKSDQGNFEVQMQRLAEYDAGAGFTPPVGDGRIVRGRIDLERQVRDLENKLWR